MKGVDGRQDLLEHKEIVKMEKRNRVPLFMFMPYCSGLLSVEKGNRKRNNEVEPEGSF